jgi:hypothetical protein
MPLIAQTTLTCFYRVEVSGWDHNEAFFVENSELEWDQDSRKRVVLRHGLVDKAIIFVRLLEPMEPERAFPVAYEAEFLQNLPEGLQEFRLNQIRPRFGPKRA